MKTKRNNRSGRKLSQRRMLTKLKKRSSTGRRSRRVIGGRRPFGEEADFEIGSKRSRDYEDDDVEMPVAKKYKEESYTLYTFDNSDESRRIVGIDTPEMKDVTVNDFINAIENAYQDLRKNRFKSLEEKRKEEEFKERMFAEVFPLLPQTGLEKANLDEVEKVEAKFAEESSAEQLEPESSAELQAKDDIQVINTDFIKDFNYDQDEFTNKKPITNDFKKDFNYDQDEFTNKKPITYEQDEFRNNKPITTNLEHLVKVRNVLRAIKQTNMSTINPIQRQLVDQAPYLQEVNFVRGGAPMFSGNLQTTLTMDKLRMFLTIVNDTVNSTENWYLRINNFLKYMFNSPDTQISTKQQSNGGHNIKLRGEKIDDYDFDLIQFTFTKFNPNATRQLFASMPLQLKLAGAQELLTFAYTLKSVPPFCRSYKHDDIAHETKNTNIFHNVGQFNQMSSSQLRHLAYTVIAYVIFSNNGDTFQSLCDHFGLAEEVDLPYEHISSLTKVKVKRLLELVKPEISADYPNKLPYFLFYTTFDNDYVNNIITQSDIRMINPKFMRDDDIGAIDDTVWSWENISIFVDPFRQILDKIYTQIFKNVRDKPATEFKFNITIPSLPGEGELNKVHIKTIPRESNYALRFEFGIKIPSTYDPIESDRIGKDGKGSIFDQAKKVHSFTNDKLVEVFKTRSRTESASIQDICEINRYLFNLNSRIPIHRDNILGYLSDIVYYPNDVVKKLSTDYMTDMSGVPGMLNKKLYYIGGFDDDPSYPYAFSQLEDEPPKPSYSRVHAWLFIRQPEPQKKSEKPEPEPQKKSEKPEPPDVELYYVARGSKTGYDWHGSDMDISNGILFSMRNLDAINVLRNIISKINELILSNELPGMGKRNIQIYSSGHSLGGNLALSISYISLNQHLMQSMSFSKLSGVRSSQKTGKDASNKRAFIRPFIIPIVFDPFVASIPLFSAYSTIPYAHIHSCIDSTFQHNLPEARSVKKDFTKAGMKKSSETPYDDPASGMFINYLRQKHSHEVFNAQMGKFRLFLYKNPHNFFENTDIHYPQWPGSSLIHPVNAYNRMTSDMTRSHDLREMIGIKANYVWVNEPTKLFIKTYGRNQSMQISAYIYPTPPGIRFKLANSALEERDNGSTVDTFILTNARSNAAVDSFLPRNKTGLLDECKNSLNTDFNRFFTDPTWEYDPPQLD
jgi:hypothetical protein